MVAVVPIVAGFLLALSMPLRIAIAVQAVLYLAAAGVLIASAPDHGSTHATGALIALVVLPLAALSIGAGMWVRSRRVEGAE